MSSSCWPGPAPDGTAPTALFCDNETNDRRLYGSDSGPQFPKDGINDHVVRGDATVNPDRVGTKVSLWYQVEVAAGASAELRLRLRPVGTKPRKLSSALGKDVDRVVALRRKEADEFYAELTPADRSADEAAIMRQAFAGMLWSKQLYAYDVQRWLDGDPTQPVPPAARLSGRNSRWSNFDSFDIMSMPDKWEYPWFAAWDLGFHCVALAHVDPAFAKYQLLLICREWFQHPNGALPAYEWDFGDVNPPVQAWAALEVFAIDGGRDLDFLSRVFDKLLVNFTWWVNLRGRRPATTCSKAASSGSTTSARSTGRTSRSAARSSSPTRRAGWRSTHWRWRRMGTILQPRRPAAGDRPRAQVPGTLRRHPPGDGTRPACGTTPTASTTTSW